MGVLQDGEDRKEVEGRRRKENKEEEEGEEKWVLFII